MYTKKTFHQYLLEEAQKPFSGWDFSYIQDRVVTAPLSWSYTSLLLSKMRHVKSLLDMDTGGGELLSRLRPFPQFTCATESFEPNIPIARSKLEPLGVQIFTYDHDNDLPFADNQFELIINRHGSYAPEELSRIIQPGGEFITQQVGQENDLDINRFLGASTDVEWAEWNASYAAEELRNAGFKIIDAKDAYPTTRIFDIGALVYLLTAIPWQIPDFGIDRYLDSLYKLNQQIEHDGFIEIKSHRFLIIAKFSE